jgi:hypothetical protein
MIWVVVALVAVAVIAALYVASRRSPPGADPVLPEPPAEKASVAQPPSREPVFFKRYRPEDSDE